MLAFFYLVVTGCEMTVRTKNGALTMGHEPERPGYIVLQYGTVTTDGTTAFFLLLIFCSCLPLEYESSANLVVPGYHND